MMSLVEIHQKANEVVERPQPVVTDGGTKAANDASRPGMDTYEAGHRGRDMAYNAVKYGLAAIFAAGGFLAAGDGGAMAGAVGGATGAVTFAWLGGKLGLKMRGSDTEGLGEVLNAGLIGGVGLLLGAYLGTTTGLQGGWWAQAVGTVTGGLAGYGIGKLITALHKSQR